MRQVAKDLIADQVRSFFNDRGHGDHPVERREDGLFGSGSVAWKVHGDTTTMMIGGAAALLLQMLHPAVLAGVWDHSNFRKDMHGRLRRTARFIAVTTYGSRAEAERAIQTVRDVHSRVTGNLPDGTPYSANDPALLAWVHATEAWSFLEARRRYAELSMPRREQDRYFAEMREVAVRLGAGPVPSSHGDLVAYMEGRLPELEASDRSREVVRLLLDPPVRNPAFLPLQRMIGQAAVDLLPDWARKLHGLHASTFTRPLVFGGTVGVGSLLRWAFR
jgi:uncharacterized protein (DUF2236 family)